MASRSHPAPARGTRYADAMICEAANELRNGDVVFVGIGLPSLACNLARATHAPNVVLVYESGTIDTRPARMPLSIGDPALVAGAAMVAPMADVFQLLLQRGHIDVGFLGAAQIDREGNLNTTVVGTYDTPRVRLPGSGGAADIAAHARRVLVMATLERRAFPERVDFVTSPGARVRRVITDQCVFDRDDARNELVLSALFPGVTVEDVRVNIGWDLAVAPTLRTIPQPESKTLETLRRLRAP